MRVVIQVIQVNQKRQASLTLIQQMRAQVELPEQTTPGVIQAGVDLVEVELPEQTILEVTQAGVDPAEVELPEQTILEVTQAGVEQLIVEVEN